MGWSWLGTSHQYYLLMVSSCLKVWDDPHEFQFGKGMKKEESRRQAGRVSWKSKCLGIIYWSFHARQTRLVSRDILNVTSPNKKWSETEDIDKNSLFWLWTSEFHKAFLLKFFRINLIVWIYFFFCLFLFF